MILISGPVGLVERALALFEPVQLRMYFATIIGRTRLRAPFGARRNVPLQQDQPTQIAKNDSKARALLVNAQISGGPPVILAGSQDAGATNFATPGNALINDGVSTFVLGPDEQLFATSQGVGAFVVVGQEWF